METQKSIAVCIAGLCFDLHGGVRIFDKFVCCSKEKDDGQICFVSSPISDGTEILFAVHNSMNVYSLKDGSWLFTIPQNENGVQVSLSADFSVIKCFVPPCEDETAYYPALRTLFRMAFECVCIQKSRLSLHSACIEVNGEAVAFTGVSGIGKSTRASAWVSARNAVFISGDRPVLGIDANGVSAYGVPWDGKEQIFTNLSVPLKAILDVRRSEKTYLRKLDGAAAQKVLMKQVFVPMWDTSTAVTAIMNVRKLSSVVPVYRLFCGPDEKSAEEAYKILFDEPEKILEAAKDMKIKEGFVLRKIADEYIVMPTGSNIASFDGAVALNEVSAFLFEKLCNAVSKEDLLIALLDEYEVDKETAERDINALISKFEEMGIIEQ